MRDIMKAAVKEQGGGAVASVGHRFGFGNTEEEYRVLILGCKEQGRKHQGPLDHTTGKGWVKQRDGCYKDALLNKKNEVQVILHETLGGGFSPPAVAALHANKRQLQDRARRCRLLQVHVPASDLLHHPPHAAHLDGGCVHMAEMQTDVTSDAWHVHVAVIVVYSGREEHAMEALWSASFTCPKRCARSSRRT